MRRQTSKDDIERIRHLYKSLPRDGDSEEKFLKRIGKIVGVSVATARRYRTEQSNQHYADVKRRWKEAGSTQPAICPACGMRDVSRSHVGAKYGFCVECAAQYDAQGEVQDGHTP